MKNIAIVGCNRGIGLALAKKYKDEGHQVYGFCRKTSNELNELGLAQVVEGFDVLNPQELEKLIQTNIDVKFDRLLHVSGILTSESLDNFNYEQVKKQFEVNTIGPIASVKSFLSTLNENSKVGLVTSRMGSIEDNSSGGRYGYRMSKAALNMAGKSMAIDLEPQKIGVYLLHPGYVQTDMTGNNGNINTTESADGLFNVFESKTLSDSGTFWHMNGEQLPW